jgi:hypothetical protein
MRSNCSARFFRYETHLSVLRPLTLGGGSLAQPTIGKFGQLLLLVVLLLIICTAVFLPLFLNILGLSMPAKWGPITRIVVQITVGSWVGTVAVSIVRVAVFLYASRHPKSARISRYGKRRTDVMNVRDFTLWFLGIMTVLAAYATSWFT